MADPPKAEKIENQSRRQGVGTPTEASKNSKNKHMYNNKKIRTIIVAIFLTGLVISPLFVFAEQVPCKAGNTVECETGGLIKSKECACCGDCTLTDALAVFINVADLILKYVGVVALLMLIFGGVLWILSGGNESQIKKGKDVIKYTFLGIVIIFAAWVIVNFVIDKLVVDKSIFQGTWWGGKDKGSCFQTWVDCEDKDGDGNIDAGLGEGAVWSSGCKNDAIKEVQQKLNQLNCSTPELKVDGCFGPQTSSALSKFQNNYYVGEEIDILPITVGSLDIKTYNALQGPDSDVAFCGIGLPGPRP